MKKEFLSCQIAVDIFSIANLKSLNSRQYYGQNLMDAKLITQNYLKLPDQYKNN